MTNGVIVMASISYTNPVPSMASNRMSIHVNLGRFLTVYDCVTCPTQLYACLDGSRLQYAAKHTNGSCDNVADVVWRGA